MTRFNSFHFISLPLLLLCAHRNFLRNFTSTKLFCRMLFAVLFVWCQLRSHSIHLKPTRLPVNACAFCDLQNLKDAIVPAKSKEKQKNFGEKLAWIGFYIHVVNNKRSARTHHNTHHHHHHQHNYNNSEMIRYDFAGNRVCLYEKVGRMHALVSQMKTKWETREEKDDEKWAISHRLNVGCAMQFQELIEHLRFMYNWIA